MSDLPELPQAPRNLPALLTQLHRERFTGAVVVSGSPGATIHLRDGLVGAIHTPGAPTAESVLLKSLRISEEQWTAARAACRADSDLAVVLTQMGCIGRSELEVVCVAAVFDGAFAMALSPPGSWQLVSGQQRPELVAHPGVEPQPLVAEAARRIALLSGLWGSPGDFARGRVRRSTRAESGNVAMTTRYRDILLSANGRRTPRDIAFALGRGVYPVMLDLTRLRARDLVDRENPAGAGPLVAPRTAPSTPAVPEDGQPLPRRSPGNHLPEAQGAMGIGTAAGDTGTGTLRRVRAEMLAPAFRRAQSGNGGGRGDGEDTG